MDRAEVNLPGGLRAADGWSRKATLRSLSGRDEDDLLECVGSRCAASRTTEVLCRCVSAFDAQESVTAERVRSLRVGDREALLLGLRRLTLGDRMSCVLVCPNRSCGQRMDLDLSVSELLLPQYADAEDVHEMTVRGPDEAYSVRFRLPNGEDQEAAAELARSSPEEAAALILRRCVQSIVVIGSERSVDHIPSEVSHAVPARMAELDPQAEIILDLSCPACGEAFRAPFDAGEHLWRELSDRRRDLYRQVHLLAFHYHWAEDKILSLPRQKRLLYLDLLADELTETRSR